MDVRIERVAPVRVAFIRHTGPYSEVSAAWGRLMTWAGRQGLLNRWPKILGVVHDDPEVTPPEKIRYDACLVVDERVRPEGDIGIQEVGSGEYAVTTHRGPYDKLGETYARLCGEWLAATDREIRFAPSFEVYRNSPRDSAPADLLTDIYLPLEDY